MITCFRYVKKGNFVDFCPDIETGQHRVNIGEQYHMHAVTIVDEESNASDHELIILTFQYLPINNNKVVKTEKLNNDSIIIGAGSIRFVFNCKPMIVNIKKQQDFEGLYKHQSSGFKPRGRSARIFKI